MQTIDAGGARFELVGLIAGVPIVHDLDLDDHTSVTNAAEAVVPAVLAELTHDGMRPEAIVYRDSMGVFDALLVDEGGRFAGYLSLGGATSHSAAFAALPEKLAAARSPSARNVTL